MALRWVGAATLETHRNLRRIAGHRCPWMLRAVAAEGQSSRK